MTTIDKSTAEMSDRELGQVLFENDLLIRRSFPAFAPASTTRGFDDDDVEDLLSYLPPAFEQMCRGTVAWYRDDAGEVQERDRTDEEIAKLVDGFKRLVWLAGGDPVGYTAPDEDEDDNQELAREELASTLASATGWFLEVSTSHRDTTDGGSRYSTWAITTTAWFWGPTFHAALDAALAWDELEWR